MHEQETTESLLFRQAEQLQNEAKSLQSKATDLYRLAASIKQLTIDIATKNSAEVTA